MPPFSNDYGSTNATAVVSPPPSPTTLMEFPAKPLHNDDDNDSMDTRKTRVRFLEKVEVYWIQSILQKDRPDYYMSRSEFDSIKKDCADVVAKAKIDAATETRGLESSLLTGEKFLKAYLHRRGALRAVFQEQTIQKETGYKAPEDIAGAYAVFSRKSMNEARSMAESDAVAMQQSSLESA